MVVCSMLSAVIVGLLTGSDATGLVESVYGADILDFVAGSDMEANAPRIPMFPPLTTNGLQTTEFPLPPAPSTERGSPPHAAKTTPLRSERPPAAVPITNPSVTKTRTPFIPLSRPPTAGTVTEKAEPETDRETPPAEGVLKHPPVTLPGVRPVSVGRVTVPGVRPVSPAHVSTRGRTRPKTPARRHRPVTRVGGTFVIASATNTTDLDESLLVNGDFEVPELSRGQNHREVPINVLPGWTSSDPSAFVNIIGNGYQGVRCQELKQCLLMTGQATDIFQDVNVTQPGRYVLRLQYRGLDRPSSMIVEFGDELGTIIARDTLVAENDTWRAYQYSKDISDTPKVYRITLRPSGAVAGGVVDNVEFGHTTPETPPFLVQPSA